MIELRQLRKRFDHADHDAVGPLDLRVPPGELLALVGTSGSGKSTTLHMINRLVEPSAGSVLIDGIDISGQDPVALRRGIGFVFQAIGLFAHMSVADNIAITPRLLRWPRDEVAARVDGLLELVHLDPAIYRARMPHQLSGGQRQRAAFARALAARPRIMLMDEPFGALDPLTRDELSAEFRTIHEKLGLTSIIVTHDMTEAFLLADRIAVMRAGRLVQIGTARALLADPADEFVRQMVRMPRLRAARLARAMGEPG